MRDYTFMLGILFQMWGAVESQAGGKWELVMGMILRTIGIVLVIVSIFGERANA